MVSMSRAACAVVANGNAQPAARAQARAYSRASAAVSRKGWYVAVRTQ